MQYVKQSLSCCLLNKSEKRSQQRELHGGNAQTLSKAKNTKGEWWKVPGNQRSVEVRHELWWQRFHWFHSMLQFGVYICIMPHFRVPGSLKIHGNLFFWPGLYIKIRAPRHFHGPLQISKWLSKVSSYLAGASFPLPPVTNNNEMFYKANSQIQFYKKIHFCFNKRVFSTCTSWKLLYPTCRGQQEGILSWNVVWQGRLWGQLGNCQQDEELDAPSRKTIFTFMGRGFSMGPPGCELQALKLPREVNSAPELMVKK